MTILHGDCLDILPTLDAESIDAIVTDPPYGLEFMGRDWDSFSPVDVSHGGRWSSDKRMDPKRRLDGEARGRGPSYGGKTYTSVCRSCGKRDAFRSPHGCDAPWDRAPVHDGTPPQMLAYGAFSEAWAVEALRVAKPGAHLLAFGGTRTYHRLACAIEDAGWEVRDCLVWAYASGFPKSHNLDGDRKGWGTALKPAWEPIILARKPLRGTVAANVQEYGTGALNIDGCRIPTDDIIAMHHSTGHGVSMRGNADESWPEPYHGSIVGTPALGRWPANLILTDPLFDGDMEGVVGGGGSKGGRYPDQRGPGVATGFSTGRPTPGGARQVGDSGTYSRFFLIPKASRSDREPKGEHGLPHGDRVLNSGSSGRTFRDGEWVETHSVPRQRANTHPTVKPTALMRHLVRLVTPPGGVVLDPFLGSGTTALACEEEGFDCIGIEREAEYVRIAEARLAGVARGLGIA